MLPGRHRLRASSDFTAVLRSPRGVRTRSRLVVTHATQTDARTGAPPRVGLVVSKAVGSAVERNRVKRRIRGILAARLDSVPAGTDLVVRANPGSAAADFVALEADVTRTLDAAVRRLGERAGR